MKTNTAIPHHGKDAPYQGKEEDFQKACAKYLALCSGALYFHPPNGGNRSMIAGAKMKAAGARAGVADFIILEPRGPYPGLIIELKVKRGRLSTHQDEFLTSAMERGYCVLVVWNLEAFVRAVEEYLSIEN